MKQIQTTTVSEDSVNMLTSIQAIYFLSIANLFAWIISKYGRISYYLMLGNGLMVTGMFLVFLYDIYRWNEDGSSLWFLCSFLISYVSGAHFFFATAFSCLFLVCSPQSVAMINMVTSIGTMLGCMIQSYLFGLIADETGSYSGSIFLCLVPLAVGMVLSVVIHVIDVMDDGPLHKSTQEKKEYETIGDDEQHLLHRTPSL